MENKIHPTVVIDGDVQIGQNNEILPYTILTGPLSIGNDNIIGPYTVIGSPGATTREPRYDSSKSRIEIGSNNIIRENVAIQKSLYERSTFVGNNVHIMRGVDIPHDVQIEDDASLTASVLLAGSVRVLQAANLAMGCKVHQRSVIGQYSIAAMGSVVMKNIRPFSRYIPEKTISVNKYAIEKFGFNDQIDEIVDYVISKVPVKSPNLIKIIEHYEILHKNSAREEY